MPEAHAVSVGSARRAWFGLFAGPIAWTLQLVFGYALVTVACSTGAGPLYLLSAAAIVVTAAALVLAYSQWRRLRQHVDARGESFAFLTLVGSVTSVIFLILTVATMVNVVLLEPCRLR